MRTFMAIELDPALRTPLLELLREKLPRDRDVRWCHENQLHLTLKFLGEVDEPRVAEVCAAAGQACAALPPFPLKIKDLGVFPAPRNPRVLWCGVMDPTEGCRRWVERADPLLAKLGFEPERRAFTPHITLGRSRSSGGSRVLRKVLETVQLPETAEMLVRQVVVFESRLLPGGAQYTPISTLQLAG